MTTMRLIFGSACSPDQHFQRSVSRFVLQALSVPARLVLAAFFRRPDEPVDSLSYLASDAVHHVLVPRGHSCSGPAHEPHNCALGDSENQQDRGSGVPSVVQTAVANLRVVSNSFQSS